MNGKELMFGYDREADVLYISLGTPQKGMQYIELSSNLVLRIEPKSQEIIGITIIDFSKQFSGKNTFSKIPVLASFLPDAEIHSVLESASHRQATMDT